VTTYDAILAFIKRKRRIPSTETQFDSEIADDINTAYRLYCRRLQSLGAPGLRGTATFAIVADQQDYNLASDFDVLIDNSVRYYTSGSTDFQILDIVSGPSAELWDSIPEGYAPLACRVIAGSTGTQRKLRLLPAFSETGKTVAYAYWKRPATLSAGVTLELPELSDAVAWSAVAGSFNYFRDDNTSGVQVALAQAKAAFNEALGTLNP
jgi:hypothetical protein